MSTFQAEMLFVSLLAVSPFVVAWLLVASVEFAAGVCVRRELKKRGIK